MPKKLWVLQCTLTWTKMLWTPCYFSFNLSCVLNSWKNNIFHMRIVGLLRSWWLNLNFWCLWINIFFTCCFSFPFKTSAICSFSFTSFWCLLLWLWLLNAFIPIILRAKSFLQNCLLLEYLPLTYISIGMLLFPLY